MEQSQQTQATQLDADTQNYWPLGYFEGQDSIRLEGVQNDGDFEMKYGGIEGRLVREYRRKTENAELLNLPMYKKILESMGKPKDSEC
ncbi:hypothetical protein AX774_g5520 [Zancudomyces culisetae]|uniref:Uncharacterized protein n=1 Tax=Zancudomyces culisetae TaxID=1213189 RepID=A0A1R1PJA2_ZANCU|nr:hypothetical protein AX774_g5520 [Zancudomyces culisetae]|eukprot:OMH81027.1 hypothetical protein AX774_g5520 [Zancudomyces culisetae]